MTVTWRGETHAVMPGELKRLEADRQVEDTATIQPAKGLDMGAGPGQPVETPLYGGVVGVLLDGRGRPLTHPAAAG